MVVGLPSTEDSVSWVEVEFGVDVCIEDDLDVGVGVGADVCNICGDGIIDVDSSRVDVEDGSRDEEMALVGLKRGRVHMTVGKPVDGHNVGSHVLEARAVLDHQSGQPLSHLIVQQIFMFTVTRPGSSVVTCDTGT